MITKKEQCHLNGLKACAGTGCHADDRLVYLNLLLSDPRQEICDAIDPEWIARSFTDFAQRFRDGTVGGPNCKATIDLILATGDQRLIGALDPEWIIETRETLYERYRKSQFALQAG